MEVQILEGKGAIMGFVRHIERHWSFFCGVTVNNGLQQKSIIQFAITARNANDAMRSFVKIFKPLVTF